MGNPFGWHWCCHCMDCEPPFEDGGREEKVEDTYKQMYDMVSAELVGLHKQNRINYEKMEELRGENDKTCRALNRLSRAIEAIQLCPHRVNCPVSSELSLSEDGDKGKPHSGKSRTEGNDTADGQHRTVTAAGNGARGTGDDKRS